MNTKASVLALCAGLAIPAAALAQPATQGDLGTLVAGTPVTFNTGGTASGEVKWWKFTLSAPVSYQALKFLDVHTEGAGSSSNDPEIAIYNSAGQLMANDDDDYLAFDSALSFGTGKGNIPTGTSPVVFNGRDGDLPAGVYYLAVSRTNVIYGATNFSATPGSPAGVPVDIILDLGNLVAVAPASFTDLGTIANPGSASGIVAIAPSEVKWFKAVLPGADSITNYIDMDTEGSSTGLGDTRLSLYGPQGALLGWSKTGTVFTDNDDGTGLLSQLTFGQVAPNRAAPGDGLAYNGRDGLLRPGIYYVAVAAPGTAPATNNVSSTNFGHLSTSTDAGTVNLNINVGAISVNPSGSGSVSPVFGAPGDALTMQVTVTPGAFPPSTGLGVTVDGGPIGIGSITLLDNGVAPDAVAGDRIYTATRNSSPSATSGSVTLPATISDAQGRTANVNLNYTVVGAPLPCPTGDESFPFTDLVSDGAVNGGANGVATINATGTYNVNTIRMSGRFAPGNAFSANARIRLTAPGGGTFDLVPILTNGTVGIPQDVTAEISLPCASLSASGAWEVRTYESVDDGGVDGTWTNLCIAFVGGTPPANQWSEDACGTDAGELIESAQIPTGSGPLTKINGQFAASDIDMFKISICDVNTFAATLVNGSTTADTQLFLFDSTGLGVMHNDDSSETPINRQSNLNNLGALITAPGDYYLAVGVYNRDPQDAGGALLWINTPFYTIRAPDGPGALNPIAGWQNTTATTGTYTIDLTGVCYPGGGGGGGCNRADITEVGGTTEAPGIPDGQLTVDDLILFINFFSDGTGCPGATPCNRADVTGVGGGTEPPDGQLTVDDLIEFINAFSTGC